jgi:two-component system sensor histidine kinase/response regulator
LLNAEKVKLFSIIAHDLRTPLASVQQYFDVMTHVEMDAEERAEMEKSLMHTIGNTQELLTNCLNGPKTKWTAARRAYRRLNLAPT